MRVYKVILEKETGDFTIRTIKRKKFLGKRITVSGMVYLLDQESNTTFPVYKQAFLSGTKK